MKKFIYILIGVLMTMCLSSCFGTEFWDDGYYYPGGTVVVVHDHHPVPHHGPVYHGRGHRY